MASTSKTYTLADVKQHTNNKSCWLVVHGKVYDVTDFLEEHPGGYDIIVQSTGKDATQDFDEIGHSNSAKQLLEKYLIGQYEGGDSAPAKKAAAKAAGPSAGAAASSGKSSASRMMQVLLPILLLLIAVAINVYLSSKK